MMRSYKISDSNKFSMMIVIIVVIVVVVVDVVMNIDYNK